MDDKKITKIVMTNGETVFVNRDTGAKIMRKLIEISTNNLPPQHIFISELNRVIKTSLILDVKHTNTKFIQIGASPQKTKQIPQITETNGEGRRKFLELKNKRLKKDLQ